MSAIIPIKIVEGKTSSFVRSFHGGRYEFEVNAPVNLPLLPARYQLLSEDMNVFSLEYKLSGCIWQAVLSVSQKIQISIGDVEPSDEWKELAFDIEACRNALADVVYVFDKPLSLSIIPLPTSPEVKMSVRRIMLRPRNNSELERSKKRGKFAESNKESNYRRIKEYLTEKSFPCIVERVTVGMNEIAVAGKVDTCLRNYSLAEIPPFKTLSAPQIICEITPSSQGAFTISVPRQTDAYGGAYDRVYSRFAVVVSESVSHPLASCTKYADSICSCRSIPKITPDSKKGLGDFRINGFLSDLDELGISFITINFRINDFLHLEKHHREDIPFSFMGKVYYADRKVIEEYDRALLAASLRKIIVCAIVLVRPERTSKDKAVGLALEHPEYDMAGVYTMPDLSSVESLNLFAAAVDFLSERYSREDCKFGHVHRWIVGNEVESGWRWCNCGKKSVVEYVDQYLKTVRVVWGTVKGHDSNAIVYIPLSHFWNSSFDRAVGYSGLQLLASIKDFCDCEGDFDWGVAFHAYPQTLWESKSWLDSEATNQSDTALITLKNLEVLDRWADSTDNLFCGKVRSIILSEQNPGTMTYSQKALDEQAASLAIALEKVSSCKNIEAYVAHSWIDDHYEGGLRTGLRRYIDDEKDPCGKKPSWFVMEAYGTSAQDEVMSRMKAIIVRTDG